MTVKTQVNHGKVSMHMKRETSTCSYVAFIE